MNVKHFETDYYLTGELVFWIFINSPYKRFETIIIAQQQQSSKDWN